MTEPEDVPELLEPDELTTQVIKMMTDNQQRVRRLFRRWLIIATIVILLGQAFNANQQHATKQLVNRIRSSQVANAKTNRCTTKSVNNQDADVLRALLYHDMNPADYKPLKKC